MNQAISLLLLLILIAYKEPPLGMAQRSPGKDMVWVEGGVFEMSNPVE